MFRTIAHRPQIIETILAHMDAVLKTGSLSTALKEFVIVRTFTRLRGFYSEGEVVELMASITLSNYFNRFNDLLKIEPTKSASADEPAQVAEAYAVAA